MRVPSDEYLHQSLLEVRSQATALYQEIQAQEQDQEITLPLQREIAHRIRQIDGMILALKAKFGFLDASFCRDLFRILNSLRSELFVVRQKVQGSWVPLQEPMPNFKVVSLYSNP